MTPADDQAAFVCRRVGTNGYEILNANGVIAWAVDEYWAMLIVKALSEAANGS